MALNREAIGTALMAISRAKVNTCYQYDCFNRIAKNEEYYFNHNSTNTDECFCSEYCLRKFESELQEQKKFKFISGEQ
jgi:hypothetical protein